MFQSFKPYQKERCFCYGTFCGSPTALRMKMSCLYRGHGHSFFNCTMVVMLISWSSDNTPSTIINPSELLPSSADECLQISRASNVGKTIAHLTQMDFRPAPQPGRPVLGQNLGTSNTGSSSFGFPTPKASIMEESHNSPTMEHIMQTEDESIRYSNLVRSNAPNDLHNSKLIRE
jgi:hypothetical protein